MKVEATDINKDELIAALSTHYVLNISTLRFFPKGEDAYAYVALAEDGTRHFVRVQPAKRPRNLQQAYETVAALHDNCGLSQVIAPYSDRQGRFTVSVGNYTLAVFPFIEGRTLYELRASESDLISASRLLAAVHSQTSCVGELQYRETFRNPFEEPILRALALSPDEANASGYRGEALRLIKAEQRDLIATLEQMRRFQQELGALALDFVVTHGDPNLDNLLKDPAGTLHLSDWGEVGLGPAERDLSAFTGDDFELFLRSYQEARGPIRLYPQVFTFYFYRWTMQEIADYSTRLLFQDIDPVEQEHAWNELQDYLPVQHTGIEQAVMQVARVIDEVPGAK